MHYALSKLVFLTLVGVVNGGQDRRMTAFRLREVLKSPYIFWEAGAAIASTRVDELIADPWIGADALSYQLDIGANRLGNIGDLVDKADLRGQHRVGCVFRQLGTARVHEHKLVAVAVERRVHALEVGLGVLRVCANNDAVRALSIAYCRTFL